MDRPTHILYPNGVKGEIKWRATLKSEDTGNEISGMCTAEPLDGTIWISTARSERYQARTLLHELLHRSLLFP